MKRCTKCGEEKNEGEFNKDKRKKDGLSNHCKKCKSKYYRSHKEKNKKGIAGRKPMSASDAKRQDRQVGAIPVGKYINSYTPREYRCTLCKRTFFRRPAMLWNLKAINCKNCVRKQSPEFNENKTIFFEFLRSINAEPLSSYEGPSIPMLFRCLDCSNTFERTPQVIKGIENMRCRKCITKRIQQHNRKCPKEFEKVIESYGGILLESYIDSHSRVKFMCPTCNEIFYRKPSTIRNPQSVHCTSCNRKKNRITIEMAEKKAAKAGAILNDSYVNAYTKANFRCPKCSRIFKRVPSIVWNEKAIYCRKCSFSAGTSKIVIDVLLPSLLKICGTKESKVEVKINGVFGYVDILIDDIAIEYDGYYWHRQYENRRKREMKKSISLIKAGYKVLRIRSEGSDIPTRAELKKAINKLRNGERWWRITMKSWLDREKQHLGQYDIQDYLAAYKLTA